MSTESDINAQFRQWRLGIKRKFRGIASFHDRARMRFEVIERAVYPRRVMLDNWLVRRAYYRGPGKYDYIDADYQPIRLGERWGGPDITGFFKRTVEVPREFDGCRLALRLAVGGDGLLFIDGEPYQGLDPFRYIVPLRGTGRGGSKFEITIEQYINWHCGPTEKNAHCLDMAELAVFDEEVHRAYWDLKAIEKALEIPQMDVGLKDFLETRLWDAMKEVPLSDRDPRQLREAILAAGEQVRQTVYASDRFKGEGLQFLVGHSHLDIVYMWPEREYLRKVGRTHSTMLRMMEMYPQFHFSQSQAKIYADMKEHFPALYEQVKKRVAEGRWEPVGAFWIEPDCNLISGESFVRQIMHGQAFFEREFGLRSRTCWQPDVFGMSWGMVQILARSGIEYLISNKMVPWNDTNEWTLHTFHWEGLDGSRVLGIIPPGHFIGTVDPDMMVTQWRAFSDRKTVGQTLHVFGWGDGGGGPDIEEIESGLRYADFPGLVPTKFSTAEQAFDSIRAKAAGARIPVLRDEIYLEAHRGTYTTKGLIKKLNRQGELLCRDAEMAAALAWVAGREYPAEALHDTWQRLLTAQFHDAVPGTHVRAVWDDLMVEHAAIRAQGAGIMAQALAALVGPAQPDGGTVVVCNTLLHERGGMVALPAAEIGPQRLLDDAGRALAHQEVTDLEGTKKVLTHVAAVPGVGYRSLRLGAPAASKPPAATVQATDRGLENEFLKATFNERGELVSLFDKEHDREVLIPGRPANRFQLFEDTPGVYDAWDIVDTYREHEVDISGGEKLSVDERGPLRASLMLEKPFLDSRIRQRISLYAGQRQLVFETRVDWVERQRLLKVAFPVDINATAATYDIAFGNMERANHRNAPQDAARFEVAAHQWMDLSQGDYGVSLMNDCKYGHECDGPMMRLSLLKGSIHPDPDSDKGTHYFTYVLYPHAENWRQAGTVEKALELNQPLRVQRTAGAPAKAAESLVRCDARGVTLEAVKRSEDGRDLIVRLVERRNARLPVRVGLAWPVQQAWSCDLTEKPEKELVVQDGVVACDLRPYEIKTLRLRCGR